LEFFLALEGGLFGFFKGFPSKKRFLGHLIKTGKRKGPFFWVLAAVLLKRKRILAYPLIRMCFTNSN